MNFRREVKILRAKPPGVTKRLSEKIIEAECITKTYELRYYSNIKDEG